MNDKELDDLLSDDFLASLEPEDSSVKDPLDVPDYLPNDENHTGYKAWKAIKYIKSIKEEMIKDYREVADSQTPKSLYQIYKSEVGREIERAPQNVFSGKASFCEPLSDFLDKKNKELLTLFDEEQALLKVERKQTGSRGKRKDQVVYEYQQMREELNALKHQKAKDMLDLAISRLPLDLQQKLKVK
ncbi:hypothetical protein KO505_14465 [Psychrosphaera sp. F3M07]|uniref:hypothetical protein n=1 Tax=Psychrosphaera sp. F3M07 TaxID=2841560 RepID=UPI001C090071|nr:hypothetical protein [Psychrosphaera sp. F3M07]MBU2919147.1 hypothetical protein [Psychrosphaera sp. F3M07]